LAEQVRLRHRTVVDLLLAVGVPHEAAEADAEGIEHYVSDATLKAFGQYLQMSQRRGKEPPVRRGERRRDAAATRGQGKRKPSTVFTAATVCVREGTGRS
jgi:Mn-dependent DtxR family transcriptional regulator